MRYRRSTPFVHSSIACLLIRRAARGFRPPRPRLIYHENRRCSVIRISLDAGSGSPSAGIRATASAKSSRVVWSGGTDAYHSDVPVSSRSIRTPPFPCAIRTTRSAPSYNSRRIDLRRWSFAKPAFVASPTPAWHGTFPGGETIPNGAVIDRWVPPSSAAPDARNALVTSANGRLKLAVRGAAFVVAGFLLTLLLSAYALETLKFSAGSIIAFRVAMVMIFGALAGYFFVLPQWRRVTDEQVALELARRRDPTRLVAYAVHPGVIGTKLLRQGFGPVQGAAPDAAARVIARLAAASEVEEPSGTYFSEGTPTPPASAAHDASGCA